MADLRNPTDTETPGSGGRSRLTKPGRDGIPALLVKVLFLGVVIGTAIALTPALVGEESWFFLVAIWVITLILVATYGTKRGLPAKYLVPGVLMLVLFVVYPIGLTAQTSTTNFGDGTRSTKEEAVAFAEKHDVSYDLEIPPRPRASKPKVYADNFRFGRTENWTH